MLEKEMTLADYDLPNGDADVSVVLNFADPPPMVDSSSEDNEKDEAIASASSASETESSETESRLEVDLNCLFEVHCCLASECTWPHSCGFPSCAAAAAAAGHTFTPSACGIS